ncbi:MAG: class II fructose-bisphosphate aldolase [Clostridiales bacterium]|nr:class II fructose-bisphosphate aldolase [Clostridiales bacterium]
MPLVPSTQLLKDAQKQGYAVGSFNAENMEMIQAIIAAAKETKAPVIIQTTPGTLKYAPPSVFAACVKGLAKATNIPVALHLDHGNSFELAKICAEEGYTSLMIDGSLLSFADNVALTKRVVEMAGPIPVEAELGTVGGKEDDHEASSQYTDPQEAAAFVDQTGVSSFAVAIGTAHGPYQGVPKLDLDRLSAIGSVVNVPLVLHGTSGLPHEQVQECIRRGITKVNYATELRIVFTEAVKESLLHSPQAYDPKKYLAAARQAVQRRICELITVCGSNGKASL